MQKGVIILLSSACILSSCDNDISKSKVPSVVLNTVEARYASSEVEWEKHGNVYEAEVDLNDSTELSARIDASGKLLMQKQDISIAELDSVVMKSIQSRFRDYRIEYVERVQKDGSTFYQVQLDKKGHKDLKLVFTVDGNEEKNFSYWQ